MGEVITMSLERVASTDLVQLRHKLNASFDKACGNIPAYSQTQYCEALHRYIQKNPKVQSVQWGPSAIRRFMNGDTKKPFVDPHAVRAILRVLDDFKPSAFSYEVI